MTSETLLVLFSLIIVFVIGILWVLFGGSSKKNNQTANLRSLVIAQKNISKASEEKVKYSGTSSLAYYAAQESGLSNKEKSLNSVNSLTKRLKYANWKMTPFQFRIIQWLITLAILIPAFFKVTWFLFFVIAFLVPELVDGFLQKAIDKRYDAFDNDYPAMLLSYVSLLKTGMNAIGGLDATAKGLEEDSLVRAEIELLIERLRLGLSEEQAINAFAEDIPHPELELFVQSLLLSRKVGGGLSQTLERLAKQVRKRQQFRKQAIAVVGMEKYSSYMIAGIMTGLLGYLSFSSPDLIVPALSHPVGTKIIQTGVGLIMIGFYWSKKVTNIKI